MEEPPQGAPQAFGPQVPPEQPDEVGRDHEPVVEGGVEADAAQRERTIRERLTTGLAEDVLRGQQEDLSEKKRHENHLLFETVMFMSFAMVVGGSIVGFLSSHDMSGPEIVGTGADAKLKDLEIGAQVIWTTALFVCFFVFECILTSFANCVSGFKTIEFCFQVLLLQTLVVLF